MVQLNTLSHLLARNLVAGKYADGQGLWLVKRDRQLGKWVLRLVINGKRREMGLGRWPDVAIAEARERAATARRVVRDGDDPIEQRIKARIKPSTLTLAQAIDSCFEARKAELKGDGEAGRWMSPIKQHIVPKIGKVPVEEVDQHVLKSALEPIWHKKADTARKALNRISLTLKHAAALGLKVDLQATMKVRALLGKQRHTPEHIPSMPYREAPAYYASLIARRGQMSVLALRFAMVTTLRTSEIRFATHAMIDGDVLTIPAEVTKTNREHRVPLGVEATKIITEAKALQHSDFLFTSPTGLPMSDATMSRLMERDGLAYRPHGFRATFRTWAEEVADGLCCTNRLMAGLSLSLD
ncbi:MAG: integrase arm-type DNA-binding domain-containing protein, partial [Pseudomonadota bacterium]